MRCYYNQIQQGKTPDGNLTQDQIERLEEIGFKCTSSSDHTCKKCLRVLVAVAEQQEKDEQEGIPLLDFIVYYSHGFTPYSLGLTSVSSTHSSDLIALLTL